MTEQHLEIGVKCPVLQTEISKTGEYSLANPTMANFSEVNARCNNCQLFTKIYGYGDTPKKATEQAISNTQRMINRSCTYPPNPTLLDRLSALL